MDTDIQDLAAEAHAQFERFKDHDKVLKPSIPILYFGDLDAYHSSDLRVLTVGSNPSDTEFLDDDGNVTQDPFWRFSSIGPPGTYGYDEYKRALNKYFEGGTDYHKWFMYYNRVLKGLDANYYGTGKNTALHTDLHSPIATTTQWSELGKEASELKKNLEEEGKPLWHRLVQALEPDVILTSLSRSRGHLEDIEFDRMDDEKVIERLPFKSEKSGGQRRDQPYEVTAQPVAIGSRHATLVHGKKNYVPFMIGEEQAMEVGQAIHSHVQV